MRWDRAKYPLAILAKAVAVIENNSAQAMDIGCGFSVTVENSSLASAVKDKNVAFLVNAFHGYSHNIQCQLKNHPNIFEGVGLEDFETMERIFSASNALASVIRYASPYRRRLYIDAFFRQWDEDKYANLGTFILNNYKQALDILDNDTRTLEESKQKFNVSDEDMDCWEREQAAFFATLGQEPAAYTLQVEYVELLQALQAAQAEKLSTESAFHRNIGGSVFVTETPGSRSYSNSTSATLRLETKRRVAREKVERLLQDVARVEASLGITQRWVPGDPLYTAAWKYLAERNFHRAIDRVHELVIKRLFELQKLNIAGTGNVPLTF